jgi:NIMA-interacting peptidyl-prolyl cis-trans isomerase 1
LDKLKIYMAKHHSAPSGPTHFTQVDASTEGKIRASHLLVKHKDSRRPSSWKEAEITRTKEEALEILRGYEERIKNDGVNLGDIAVSESDCSSARKKGDLSVKHASSTIVEQSTDLEIGGSLAVERCSESLKMQPLLCSQAK